MVYIFMAQGFEAIEFTTPLDMLIRAGIPVKTVSITGDLLVKSSQNIPIMADTLFEDADFADAELLMLPGGQPGATNLANHTGLKKLLQAAMDVNKPVAAICAAPSILGHKNLLDGKKAICFPGFEDELSGAVISDKFVCKSDKFITAKGMGSAVKFGLEIVPF